MFVGDLFLDSISCECFLECEKVLYDVWVFSFIFLVKIYNIIVVFKKFMNFLGYCLEGDVDNFEEVIR